MNKRMIAVGAALAVGLGAGAGSALADEVNLGNIAGQANNQQVWLNQQVQQNQPVAIAGADASATSGNVAGGNSQGAVGSGNGIVFSGTHGGWAFADAENENEADADIGQANGQFVGQSNAAIVLKLKLKNIAIAL